MVKDVIYMVKIISWLNEFLRSEFMNFKIDNFECKNLIQIRLKIKQDLQQQYTILGNHMRDIVHSEELSVIICETGLESDIFFEIHKIFSSLVYISNHCIL